MNNNTREKIEKACNKLYQNKHDLIVNEVHERTIAAELKSYLEPLFSGWDVSIEYNREDSSNDPKRGLDGKRIIPDILIHTRGSIEGPNLAAIQVKGFWNSEDRTKDETDLKKLRAKFGYKFLYRLELCLDNPELIEIN